jgi:23S rRNA (cytidine1920-2'-O)/16S rRNA (cytidine1409-2'-O)-methyltransferase
LSGPVSARGVRLDRLLVDRGLAPNRERAQRLVMAGAVLVGDRPVTKAGTLVAEDVELRLRQSASPYVSRGGEKLAGALDAFGLDVTGRMALDVGASTGGFTDCLLRRGARRVIAVDVGYGQLAWSLRQDPRVTVIDRTNARTLEASQLPEPPDLATVDVSFISLTLVLPAIATLVVPGGIILPMVKPQFEVGREHVGKGGVVRDPILRAAAVKRVRDSAEALGLLVVAESDSILPGPKGNQEVFLHLTRPDPAKSGPA